MLDAVTVRNLELVEPLFAGERTDALIDTYKGYIAQMQPKLPDLFTVIPGSPVTVRRRPGPGNVLINRVNAGRRSMASISFFADTGPQPSRAAMAASWSPLSSRALPRLL